MERSWCGPPSLSWRRSPSTSRKVSKAADTHLNAGSRRRPNLLFIVTVDKLMRLACSSVFYGGGTNQELAHHSLYQCNGDIMVSTLVPLQ